MREALADYDHPAWFTMAGTFVGYAIALGLIFGLLFLIPFVLWP